jgi:hypothetical protein
LRLNLGKHPQVFTATEECQYFSNEIFFRGRAVARYQRNFEAWKGEPYVGEATPGYMMWRHDPDVVAGRIQSLLPDVRLLAILRNPIDRAQSAMVHHMKRGRVPEHTRLVDVVRAVPPERHRLGFIAGGWYAASLTPYRERFGDRLLVQLHDDIRDHGVDLYKEAVAHVGATDDFVPPELTEVRFSNQSKPRTEHEPLTQDDRVELYEYFREDIARLEELIDRDLSSWDPEVAPLVSEAEPAAAPDDGRRERRGGFRTSRERAPRRTAAG